MPATAPFHGGTPVMAKSYRRQRAPASNCKDGATPYSTPISGDIQPISVRGGRKLLDQFRDKMRSLHYALATEKAYRHWIVEFLRLHRDGGEWRHAARLSAEVVFPACNLVGRQLKEVASFSAAKGVGELHEVFSLKVDLCR
jgi:hypothetical protein